MKMKVTDQIKILYRNIMQNEAQHDLGRKAAKISALFSNNSDKYEYLTGEDLGLKPSTVELFLTLINLKIHQIWLQIVTETRIYSKMQKMNNAT